MTKAVLIAFIGAILGALYPALKAASKDPIDAVKRSFSALQKFGKV